MEENAYEALMMAFALFVFVIAMSGAMYLFSKVTTTSEILTYRADETNYYDNVAVVGKEGIERYVNTETVIPTLYRYYKENFCVKIYDATGCASGSSPTTPVLVQILDVNLEGRVNSAASDTKATSGTDNFKSYQNYLLNEVYNNNTENQFPEKYINMFGAPWLDSTENMKLRVDYFVNGDAGYINNQWVDYTDNPFSAMLKKAKSDIKFQFKERFVSYSYTGETMETEDGDVLVTGAAAKDKIVITYILVDIENDGINQEKLDIIK